MTEEPEGVGVSEQPPELTTEPIRRQGETARQQIRKAKVVTRRRFSAEEKIRIVMVIIYLTQRRECAIL